jgi:ketosteroid isomerase-like protein
MPESKRLELARAAYAAFDRGDRHAIETLLSEDLQFFQPAGPRHRSGRLLRALLAARGAEPWLRLHAPRRVRGRGDRHVREPEA